MTTHEWGTAPDFVGPRHELRERLLLRALLRERPGARILNVGAGQGSFTRLLEARGFVVTSTDVAPAAVDVLRERVSGPVFTADLRNLPFAHRSFDAVVAGEVLEHIAEDVKALVEARRVLADDGVIAVSVPAHPEWFGPSDVWAGHERRYTREMLEQTFAAAAFRHARVTGWGFPASAAYHRLLYDRRAAAIAEGSTRRHRALVPALRVVLQVDRLFVGVERGCLGFIAVARAPSETGEQR